MQIDGLRMQNIYLGRTRTRGDARSTAVDPVSQLREGTASARVRDTFSLSSSSGTGEFEDQLSLQYKKEKIAEYEKELEDARLNNPAKYTEMINQRAADNVSSFDQLVALVTNGQNTTAYQNVSVDAEHKQMSVSGSSGNNIYVELSNGWSFKFDRDADISGMLDLFSPEDVKRIMEAIVKDNMCRQKEAEIEDAKGSVGELLEKEKAEVKVNGEAAQESKETAKGGETEVEEESETTSQIVVNADGSRQLVVTTKIGDTELLTKIQLSPAKSKDKFNADEDLLNKEIFDEKLFEKQIVPIDKQIQNALNAYEANFMYA